MKTVQGFVNIPDLAKNEPGTVAAFGEISTRSMTFSRTIKNYSEAQNYPYVEVITFTTANEASNDIDLPPFVHKTAIQITNWIYVQSINQQIPATGNEEALESAIAAEFSNLTNSYGLTTEALDVNVGEILFIPNTTNRLVEWVSFILDDDGTQYAIKLWFSDARFQTQYSYYEHVVLPPITNIDAFNGTTPDVNTMLTSVTASSIISRINAVTDNNPATTTYTMPIRWYNPENPNSTIDTQWYVVVYGQAGIDADAIKDAIRTYISNNTNLTNWTSIFPDLYAESEFIIIPAWDAFSTPELGYDEGLYRSVLTIEQLEAIKLEKIPRSYNTVSDFYDYLFRNLAYLSLPYRSMMCLILGNPNNSDGAFSILKVFPDYMNINPDSPDFNRMTTNTQEFIVKLSEAMHKARLWGPARPLPDGFSLSTKQNREYVGFDYAGYTFYIMTRHGFLKDSLLADG